ncbi:MAG: methyltransferase family protein [Flavobacteriales bacterium]
MIVRTIANLILIWSFACFYFYNSYYKSFLNADAKNTILVLAILLSVISFIEAYFLSKQRKLNTGLKLWLSFKQLLLVGKIAIQKPQNGFKLGASVKRHLLFALVKFFFIPIMIKFAVSNFNAVRFKLNFLSSYDLNWLSINFFNDHFYGLALALIFLIDTGFFAFGYLFEARWLKNKIRSVDTSFFGWFVALACYPPFTDAFAKWAPWHTNDYAWFGSAELTFGARIILLILLVGYVAATVSLGTRCSNLTNRGIVTKGAYAIVRHPAYICKNLFWWMVLIPVIPHTPWAILGMAFWTTIYFFRAITEERHLIKDPDYRAYCEKVRWRFVPGLI